MQSAVVSCEPVPKACSCGMTSVCRVVPAGISGTYQALLGRRGYIPRRHPLAVRFGPPRRFTAEGYGRSVRSSITQRIMDDIAALLP